ncbi:uncharacterized protein [Drosophila kikkawai]|uniref:Uncharacterized protein n=1 Tax=Drosophila kikkawai TaxID=30033 RepID=A0A6P4J8M8_DROKI|nr:uncharacterized protein LOC108080614 [Drosophila kikkawai]
MNTSNSDEWKNSIWLEATDSEVLHTGFAEFVEIYKNGCSDENTVVEPKLEIEEPQSEMSSKVELPGEGSSLKSDSTLAISEPNRGVEDVGFNRFLDEWVLKVQTDARSNWMKMSKRERAVFAPRDGIDNGTSSSTLSSAGKVSSSAIRKACDKVCSNLVKRSYSKPKSIQSKRKCLKPRIAKKPKSQKKGLKPICAKKCPSPKPPVAKS